MMRTVLRCLFTGTAATLMVSAGCADRQPLTGVGLSDGPDFETIRLTRIPAPDGTPPVFCPVEAGVLMAMAGADWGDLLDTRPSFDVAVGCVAQDPGNTAQVHVALRLKVARAGEPEAEYSGHGLGLCEACAWGVGPFATAAVGGTVLTALELALDQYRVTIGPDKGVLSLLSSPEGVPSSVLLAAVGQAGDRRLPGAVEYLIRLLDSRSRDVVLRVIGSLGRIRDTDAVRPLGRIALSPAPEAPFAALRAIADIGGGEAVQMLEFVATQTTDPVIEREALDLLGERKKGDLN